MMTVDSGLLFGPFCI